MARSTRSAARRRAVAVLAVGATLAGGSALFSPTTSSASSHREAPFVSNDPAIDNTDVYAFRSPDKPNTVSFVASWSPLQEPAGGPTYYPWATDAAYDINIDNNGDALPDITYRWTFKDDDTRGAVDHGDKNDSKAPDGTKIVGNKIGGTFLYNDGPVTALKDTKLRFKQTYNLDEITYAADGTVKATKPMLANVGVPANNVGRASVPDFVKLRQQAVAAGQINGGAGGQSYVGQTDDAFFLDLRVFDLLYGTDLKEVGFDTLTRYNVNSIALQVPQSDVAALGNATRNPVIGMWSTTSRQSVRTLAVTGADTTKPEVTPPTGAPVYDAQVSRLGNPLVNEVVVPANLKDYFNRSTPSQDGALLGKVTNPELPYLVELIYGIPNPNKVPGHASRGDLVSVFLTGLAGLNSLDVNKDVVSGGAKPAEYLRLNMSTPLAPKPNRLGAVGGDVQGFPNGRRLADDITDEALQVTEGVLFGTKTAAEAKQSSTAATLGDGVNANDKKFMSTFPYIADPFSGSDPRVGQLPVKFRQVFTSTGDGRVSANVTNVSPAQPGSFAQLYRINNDGSLMGLGQFKLNAAGTGLAVPFTTGRFGTNAKVTLYFRVFANRYGVAGFNGGIPTTLTVR